MTFPGGPANVNFVIADWDDLILFAWVGDGARALLVLGT